MISKALADKEISEICFDAILPDVGKFQTAKSTVAAKSGRNDEPVLSPRKNDFQCEIKHVH